MFRTTEIKSVVVIINNVSLDQGLSLGLHFPAASEARVPRLGRRTGACFPGFSPSGAKQGRSTKGLQQLGSVRKAKYLKPYHVWRA